MSRIEDFITQVKQPGADGSDASKAKPAVRRDEDKSSGESSSGAFPLPFACSRALPAPALPSLPPLPSPCFAFQAAEGAGMPRFNSPKGDGL